MINTKLLRELIKVNWVSMRKNNKNKFIWYMEFPPYTFLHS